MTKPEWGTKRKCAGCGNFFYDMRKEEFKCPKCGAEYTAAAFMEAHTKAILKNAKKDKDLDKDLDEDELIATVVDDDAFADGTEETVDVLEDASELGDDNHDMAEVIDNIGMGDDEE